ncbi:aspartate racemase [Burkholderia ambifaria]|nr:amino acid racemase [Burkholderia ambifaria]MDR6498172.1 aspartate racemase [Burkholderia ambifaria]
MRKFRKPMVGVIGGMGSASTVDFLEKIVQLTPAKKDQDHISWVTLNLAYIPDRSAAVLGNGENPLPHILEGIDILNDLNVSLTVVPCNTAHHWFTELRQRSSAPILNIADASVGRLSIPIESRVAVLASRGTIASGFFDTALREKGYQSVILDDKTQKRVDECMRHVKSGDIQNASEHLKAVLASLEDANVSAAILGCTEIPLAAALLSSPPLLLIDSTLSLAFETVEHARNNSWLGIAT